MSPDLFNRSVSPYNANEMASKIDDFPELQEVVDAGDDAEQHRPGAGIAERELARRNRLDRRNRAVPAR